MKPSALAIIVVVTGTLTAAQRPSLPPTADGPVAFEVASIKRNQTVTGGGSIGVRPGGRWLMVNVPIGELIRTAYPAQVRDLEGAPSWVDNDPYDITAKADGNPTREQMRKPLQQLLADRFKFAAHYETVEKPVFALVVARSDGKPAPELAPFNVDCVAVRESNPLGRKWDGPSPTNGAPLCGYRSDGESYWFGGAPMSMLADTLRFPSGRVVVDKTGLTGNYHFTVKYANPTSPDNPLKPGDPSANLPTVFTAVQEQLGLKLVPDRALLQALIVDHIERPTED